MCLGTLGISPDIHKTCAEMRIIMKEFTYTVTDPQGIHARPAGEFVKLAKEFSCNVNISKDGKKGDCKKIFAIMGLGIKGGMEVVLSFDGEDEDAAYEKISAFMKENL